MRRKIGDISRPLRAAWVVGLTAALVVSLMIPMSAVLHVVVAVQLASLGYIATYRRSRIHESRLIPPGRVVELDDFIEVALPRECRLASRFGAAVAVVAIRFRSEADSVRSAAMLDPQTRESDALALVPQRHVLVAALFVATPDGLDAACSRLRSTLSSERVNVAAIGSATFPADRETPTGLVELALRRMYDADPSDPGESDARVARSEVEVDATHRRIAAESRRRGVLWRAFELTCAAGLLLLAVPVLIASFIAIKLTSPGPMFFVQNRTGLQGRPFRMYKLRTMVDGAESQVTALLHASDVEGHFKMTNDPRVTRVGKVLRALSIDELPQLLNVVRGDMSLVGPRPTSKLREDHAIWELERLTVKPGLTGPWQVYHRGQLSFGDRARLDIRYSRNRTAASDINLLMRTIPAVISMRGRH